MMFQYRIGDNVVSLLDDKIREGQIIERKYVENGHGYSVAYDIKFQFEDGNGNFSKREYEIFSGPEELVQNLLDIYEQNKDDLA